MWDWIKSWNFFNWLALLAFLLALVGFLNSFLSLKSRYKDWKGIRNKKAFKKRLSEFENHLGNLVRYDESIDLLFLDIVKVSIRAATVVLISLASLFFTLLQYFTSPPVDKVDSFIFSTPLFIGGFLLIIPVLDLFALNHKIRYFQSPVLLAEEILNFVGEGKKKDLISQTDLEKISELMEKVRKTKVFANLVSDDKNLIKEIQQNNKSDKP